ncbi:hypothetical protein FRUB_01585 [Fimbriiglobus ruber]|uniref:Uncharacterized protein n=1 Tax=Fimbriiglobus ruber TaxID=1908690 RepID=A0A225E0A9_9BACT|nr:hypothetical protein FRUB_01585 [Fimbriiglobus ruber]
MIVVVFGFLAAVGHWLFNDVTPPAPETTDQDRVTELLLKCYRLGIERRQLIAESEARPEDEQLRAAAEKIREEVVQAAAEVIDINRRHPEWVSLCGPDPHPQVLRWVNGGGGPAKQRG